MNPMPLARLHAPLNHPAWIFEPKLDGFRALAYLDGGSARLVSRKGKTLKSFPELTRALATSVRRLSAILDGEIVRLGPDGKPQFHELMRRCAPQHFVHSICCG
jgi:bifunctional non-homologous end joining protein LigD